MTTALMITELVLAIVLMTLILIQNKDGGLSAMMGGGGSFEATRRGPEKVIFTLTIIVAVLFVVNALLINLV